MPDASALLGSVGPVADWIPGVRLLPVKGFQIMVGVGESGPLVGKLERFLASVEQVCPCS
jgi:hypothetical protein